MQMQMLHANVSFSFFYHQFGESILAALELTKLNLKKQTPEINLYTDGPKHYDHLPSLLLVLCILQKQL